MKNIGKWLLVVAFALAILGGFVDLTNEWITTIVIVLAFAGAYMFIEDDKAKGWLIMALVMTTPAIVTSLSGVVGIGDFLTDVFAAFAGPFAVVALAILVKKTVGFFF